MKDKYYFFYTDWKERKKKFLRVCNECVFKVEKFKQEEIERKTIITIIEK